MLLLLLVIARIFGHLPLLIFNLKGLHCVHEYNAVDKAIRI